MGTSIYDWSQTPIENEASDGEINWHENQDPGTVNNSARAMMARIRAHIADITPSRASTGSANIYAINIASAPSSLVDGLTVAFRAHQANTGSSILQVNSFGSIPLRSVSGSALHANEIMAGRPVVAAYNASINEWLIINGLPQLAQLYGDILTESDVQDIASAYVQANPDDVRAALWILRPIVSATTTAAPTSATDGALYVVPTGATGSTWPSNVGKIAEAASGSWTYHTPSEGWSVYAKDSDTAYVYDAAWNPISAAASDTSPLQRAVYNLTAAAGTNGGTPTVDTWTHDTGGSATWGEVANDVTGVSFGSNAITFATAGRYHVSYAREAYNCADFKVRFKSTTTASVVNSIGVRANVSGVGGQHVIVARADGIITAVAGEVFKPEYYVDISAGTAGLGNPVDNGDDELYGTITIINLAAYKGEKGDDGDPGADGAGYLASSATSLTIGTGTQTLTTSSGLAYRAGDVIKIADTAAPSTNYMLGTITSYSSTSMVASVTETAGSGTKTAWTISLAGKTGTTGTAGTNGTGYGGTSSTSLLIGTGSTVWGTQAGLGYVVGSRIRWANSSTNWMEGQITDYTSTSMTVNVTKTSGSGTLAFWSASIAGEPGADGAGSGTVTDISLSGGLESDAGGTITASGSGRQAISTVVETTTTRAIGVGDRAKLIEFTNVSAKSVTLAQAQNSNRATMGFTGWFCWVLNMGAGTLTVTPTTSTIAGAASLSLANTEGALIVSDGTNYKAMTFRAGGAVDVAVGPGLVYAGPVSGASAQPAFRAIAADDLPVSGVTPGTYDSVTVDDAGIVTAGSNPALTNGTFAPASVTVSGGKITGVAAGTAALPTFQRFTDPSGGGPQTWNKPSGCKAIRYQAVGGGGQGGGCTLAAGGVGPGGGAGAPAEGWLDVTSIASLTINIGKGGSAGAVAAAGEDGGMTSIANGATNIVTCPGGKGGPLNTSVTTAQVIAAFGGLGGGPVTGLAGSFFSANYGAAGGNSARTSAAILVSGAGASSPFGMGAPAKGGNSGVVNSTGGAGLGFGSGGSGCVQVNTTNNGTHKGGSGAPGLVIIEEFY